MSKIIAFDVDDTLIHQEVGTNVTRPKWHVVDLLRWFYNQDGWEVVIWSGGGIDFSPAHSLGFSLR